MSTSSSSAVYTLAQLAEHLGAALRGGDPNTQITGLATLQEATPQHLSFLANGQYRKHLASCRAAAVLLNPSDAEQFAGVALVVPNPYMAYARISHLFETRPVAVVGVHPAAIVAEDAQIDPSASIGAFVVVESGAQIGPDVVIGAHCYIGARVQLGEGGRLAPHVTLGHDVIVGKRVVIQPGAVIGGEGFGFANEQGQWHKIAQIGGVLIGDDVEIGANTTVDRGALSNTVIANGVKLDNQIQIGHNAQIGEGTIMAACVGVSGSARIGRHCMIGGGVGTAGHIDICDNVFITGMTMVPRSINRPGTYSSGIPFQDATDWRRNVARVRQLDEMARRLAQLEKRLAALGCDDHSKA